MKKRYLVPHILRDLNEKMVFIGGARQVGKTSLAKYIAENYFKHYDYLNWDARDDRKNILQSQFKGNAEIILFDEIHKYKDWKNYLKGQFDKHKDDFKILVTGSARLDVYRRGGDSLMGRYYYYRLHPFSLAEMLEFNAMPQILGELIFPEFLPKARAALDDLFVFGGFPEPLLKKDQKVLRQFHNQYVDRLVREDIRDIESIRDLSSLQVLVDLLPHKVGALLSLNALREDLEVAHKTVALWMDILERFYYHFRIYPFAFATIKSLRKEPKMYLWDWSQVEDEAQRFENMVASHLLKFVHFLYDAEGYRVALHFLRDRAGHETDFLVTVDKKPWFAVEVKWADTQVSKSLRYFTEKLRIPFAYQVAHEPKVDFLQNGVRVMSADKFLSALV